MIRANPLLKKWILNHLSEWEEQTREKRNEYRREYYRLNRTRIIAANKRSAQKHRHEWPSYYKQYHLVTCADCGQQIEWQRAKKYFRHDHTSPAFYRCRSCHREVIDDWRTTYSNQSEILPSRIDPIALMECRGWVDAPQSLHQYYEACINKL